MAVFTLTANQFSTLGRVTLSWQHSQAHQYHYSWRVYRRLAGTPTWTQIHTTDSTAASQTYHDRIAPSNVEVEYALVETYTNSAGQNLQEGSYEPTRTVTPTDDKYWLVHPTNANLTVRLDHVKSDQFTMEYEEEELLVIGRGRKVDRGDAWGASGTLDVTFKGPDARARRQAFQLLRDSPTHVFLRNPFGDVWKVALFGGVPYTREAGVGVREFVEAGIEYREVA